MTENGDESEDKPESPAKQKLEFIAALVGAVLALGTLGIIVWDGIQEEGRPALVTLRAEAVHPHEGGFVVEIVAENAGDDTAADLLVEGSLMQGGEAVEKSEATLDYLPSHSERRGGLIFARDPAMFQLKLQAKGYIAP